MKTPTLALLCLTLTAAASWAEDYHLVQTQIADEVPLHRPLDSATVYALVLPDHGINVFRAFDSKPMEEIIKSFPRGSVLHYDGHPLLAPPSQSQVQALTAFCKSNGISLVFSPTN